MKIRKGLVAWLCALSLILHSAWSLNTPRTLAQSGSYDPQRIIEGIDEFLGNMPDEIASGVAQIIETGLEQLPGNSLMQECLDPDQRDELESLASVASQLDWSSVSSTAELRGVLTSEAFMRVNSPVELAFSACGGSFGNDRLLYMLALSSNLLPERVAQAQACFEAVRNRTE